MKLFVCDVEGTIFQAKYKIEGTDYSSTMWQPIAYKLGDDAVREEHESHQKWDNKEYENYLEWVKATILIHQKYDLKKDAFFELVNNAMYNEGVVEFFNNIDRNEYIPVLISGGFQELIDRAKRELGIEYGIGACEYIWGDDGRLVDWKLRQSDFGDKYSFLSDIFLEHSLNETQDWVFVGDGKNDVDIASRAPIAFAINPHVELASVTPFTIDSFMEIIPILNSDDAPYYISRRRGISNKQSVLLGQRMLNLGIEYESKIDRFSTESEKIKYLFFADISDDGNYLSDIELFKDIIKITLLYARRYLENNINLIELNQIIENDCLQPFNLNGISVLESTYVDQSSIDNQNMQWALRMNVPDLGTWFRQPIAGCRFKIDISVSLKSNVSFEIRIFSQQPDTEIIELESYRPKLIDDINNIYTLSNISKIQDSKRGRNFGYIKDYLNDIKRLFPIILFKDPLTKMFQASIDIDFIAKSLFTYAQIFTLSKIDFDKILKLKGFTQRKLANTELSDAEVIVFYPFVWEQPPKIYYSNEIFCSDDAIGYDYELKVRKIERRYAAFQLNLIDEVILKYKDNINKNASYSNHIFYENLCKDAQRISFERASRQSLKNRVSEVENQIIKWENRYNLKFDRTDSLVKRILLELSYHNKEMQNKFTDAKQLLVDGELVFSLLKTALFEQETDGKIEISGSVLQPFANAVEVFLRAKILLSLPRSEKINFLKDWKKNLKTIGDLGKFLDGCRRKNINLFVPFVDVDILIKDLISFSGERGKAISHHSFQDTFDEAQKRINRMYSLILEIDKKLKVWE